MWEEDYKDKINNPQYLKYHKSKDKIEEEYQKFLRDNSKPDCVFYIVRPDPSNIERLKFGISTHFLGRMDNYLCLCPELELLTLWKIPKSVSNAVEDRMINLLTKGISKQISAEVYDIKDFVRFWDRVLYLKGKTK